MKERSFRKQAIFDISALLATWLVLFSLSYFIPESEYPYRFRISSIVLMICVSFVIPIQVWYLYRKKEDGR